MVRCFDHARRRFSVAYFPWMPRGSLEPLNLVLEFRLFSSVSESAIYEPHVRVGEMK